MGADLLILSLDWKAEKAGKKRQLVNPEKGFMNVCNQIDEKIDKIGDIPYPDELDDISNHAWTCDQDGNPHDDMGNVIDLAAYKNYLHGLVQELRESWSGRDTTWFLVAGHHWVFVTGGHSWGDEPCDTFGVLSRLYHAQVV